MSITEVLLYLISNFFIATGTILITYGGLRASYKSIMLEIFRRDYKHDIIRREFTNKIIFGLEFYIAADIVETILAPVISDCQNPSQAALQYLQHQGL